MGDIVTYTGTFIAFHIVGEYELSRNLVNQIAWMKSSQIFEKVGPILHHMVLRLSPCFVQSECYACQLKVGQGGC
jgi:hypothetical protein